MRRGQVEDRRQDEFALLGVDSKEAQAWLQQQEPQDQDELGAPPDGSPGDAVPGGPVVIWPCNWAVHRLFLQLQTQWMRKPGGTLAGLPYPAVESAMRLLALKGRAKLFLELQDMEFAAVNASEGLMTS